MRVAISCLFFLFISMGNTLSVQAQQMHGRVLDAWRGEPLYGASIRLQSDPLIGGITDENGNFALSIDPANSRLDTLIVSYIGFAEKRIPVRRQSQSPIVIKLDPVISAINTVEVKAERLAAREFSTQRIRKLDIYTNPSAKADPLLAVQSLPSETSTEETANISLRGSSPSETTILLNNVPIRDAVKLDQANGIGQFSIFNTALIESVNVFTANPPLEFAGTTSGAIALFTDNKTGTNANSISLTLAGMGAYFRRKLSESTDLTLYGNWSGDHFLKGLNSNSLKRIHRFSTLDGGLYLTTRFRSGLQLKVFNYTLHENYAYVLDEPTFVGLFDQRKFKNQTVANLILPLKKGRLELNQGLNLSTGKYGAANLDNDIVNSDYFLGINYSYATDDWGVKTGLSYQRKHFRLDAIFPLYSHAFGTDYPTIAVADEESLQIPEGYLYVKRHFGEKFTLGVGGRYHPLAFGRPAYLSYQLNLNFRPDGRHAFILSGGQYHKPVPPGPDFPTTTLVRSRHLALDYQLSSGPWTVSAALYYKRSNWEQVRNNILGAELFAGLSLPNLSAGISLATVNSTLDTEAGRYPSPYDLGHYLRGIVKYDIPDWFEVNIVLRHRQGRYFRPLLDSSFDPVTQTFIPDYAPITEGQRLPDYRGFDVSLSRIIPLSFGGLIVFLSANNVMDFKNIRRYTYNFDYSNAGKEYYNRRVFFAGVVLSW